MKSLTKLAFWSAIGCALLLGGGATAEGQTTSVKLSCTPAYGPSYVGKAYSSTCTGTGGSNSYTFALGSTGGGIPAGLTLTVTSDTTARISGTPTTTGSYGFGVTITDDRYSTVSAFGFSGTVNAAPVFSCASANGPTTVGYSYSDICSVPTGQTPLTWAINSGTLPPGLTLTQSGTQATIAGTPTTAGSYFYMLQAVDVNGTFLGSQGFSGTVSQPAAFSCTSNTGPTSTTAAYSDTCTASGGSGSYSWAISSGSLPTGVALTSSGATATIKSTPPIASGSYSYTLTLTDVTRATTANQTFGGTVIAPLAINCGSNNGPVFTGYSYSDTCNASGGSGSYSWSLFSSTLPAGLTLSPTSGTTTTISGIPTTPAANYYYYLQLSDTLYNSTTQNFSGTLVAPPTITSINPTNALVNAAGFTLTVNGTNFGSNSVIYFNGTALTTTHYTTNTMLTAPVPASLLTSPGQFQVVINEGGTVASNSPATFTVAPVLTSISPTSTGAGSAQFTLTATGAGFLYNSGTFVQWNGTNLATTLNANTTSLTATVPANLVANPGTAQVTVTAGGVVSSAQTFTIQAVPTLTAVNPNVVAAGGSQFTLTVSGTNFVSGALVRWNGANLTTTYVSATQLTAIVPANLIASAGTAQVSVASNGFTTGNLPVTINTPTTITSISPTSAVAGGPAFSLTINGTNLNSNDGAAAVSFNGTPLTVTSATATQIVATVPASLITNAGNYTIAVQGSGSPTATFSVLPAPTLTSISPTSATAGGAAFTLTATGTNFTSATIVQWNGQSLTTTYVSPTQITAAVPATLIAAAGTAQVTAVLSGVSSAAQTFTISGAPTLTQINPSVVAAGGTQFTLTATGTNFASGAVVRWNGQNLTTVYVSPTQLTATVPATLIATAGTAQVSVNYAGVTTGNQTVTIYQIPTITLSPTSATAGSSAVTLTVTGSSAFLTPATVQWNGASLVTTVVSSTVLSATVPATLLASAGTAQVTVASSGLSTQPATFTIIAAPTLTSISPTSAVAGGAPFTLTATGTNFTAGSVVQWNGQSLTTTFGSATSLTAAVPATLIAAAGTAQVTVLTAGVTSTAQTFTIQAAPTLTSINPSSATAGGAAFTLTATGTNFTSASALRWNGQALTTTFVSATSLTGAVPATLIVTAGTAQVTVLQGGVSSAALPFTITNPAATLTSISPSSATAGGAAFTLTATGTNFISGTVVQWNGQTLTTTFVSATQLTAAVPATLIATAGTAQVTTLANGVSSAALPFTISNPAATLTSITPNSAVAGGTAFTLTATGTNFISGTVVQWNGQALTTTFVSATQLTAAVPATLIATAGTAQVSTASNGVSTAALPFTISNPAATLTSISPNSATAGAAAFTLTATGTNLTSTSVVQWNGQALTTTFVSATQLTAAVPATLIAAGGTAQVTVLTSGASTAPQTFTIQAASTLTSISPNSATAGGASFNLAATGTNFTANSVLRWNGQNLSTAFISATQLSAAISNTLIATPGTAQVSVVTGGVASANVGFTILSAPSITSLSPNSTTAGSAAFTLTVAGANFTTGTSVLWNGTALTSTFVSTTQLTAAVPASLVAPAGTAAVSVSQGGVISPSASFNITSAPTLASLNPNTATVGSGQFTLTVNGGGFASGATVLWNGAALTTAFVSTNQLTATVPASLLTTTGTFPVTVTSSGVTTATSLPFNVVAAATITSLNPNSTAVGGGPFLLTVTGSGFTSGSTIQWNGGSLTTAFVSATQLTTTVPATLIATVGTNQVSVMTGSVSSNTLPFSVVATPTLTSLSPTQAAANGPAFTLTVNGTGFASGAAILLNGNPLTTTFVSTTQLTAAIPADYITTVGNLPVRVTSAGIASSNSLTLQAVSQTLTQLSPSSASAGGPDFILTVTGTGFGPTNTYIYWNGETQLSTTVLSATQASATVPASLIATAGTAQVTLVSFDGAATSPLTFTINAGPTLSAISPSNAAAGSADLPITVTGTGFGPDAVVGFGAINLVTTFVSSTQLTATIPAAQLSTPATFLVIVTTGAVHTTQLLFNVVAAPTLTSLSPNSATAGAAGFPLTVNGTGFASTATVLWNNANLATTYVSATQLIATVPAALIATPGTAQVAVQSNGVLTGTLPVAINAPTPVIAITSLSPSSAVAGGSAFNLVISGTNVNAINAAAYFNGTLLTTLSGSGTQLTVSVPAALIATAGTYSVQVSAPGYTTGSASFNVTTPAATLTSLSPASATVSTGTFTLTVNGAGFASGATVLWNGAALTTAFVNATQLTAAVPASLLTTIGTFPVTVVSGGVATLTSLPFSVVPAPTVTSLSPNTTAVGGAAFPLTVTGTGFTATSAIQWNGGALTTVFVSATQLRTTVPASFISALGTEQVSVANGSTSSNALPFAVVATPTLTSLSPAQTTVGSAAFTLTVNGSGFTAGATVNWNYGEGSNPLTTTFVNSTQLTAAVPASYLTSIGTFTISVTSSGITSGNTLNFQVVSQSLTSLSPSSATAGGPAFTLTVNGAGFGPDATVVWGESSLPTTFVNSTQVTAAVPATLIANPGTAQVSVFSNDYQSANSLPFTIVAGPTLSSLSPNTTTAGGPTFTLTVNGTGFASDATVFFNGAALTTIFVSDTQLNAVVQASQITTAGSATIAVVSGGVNAASPLQFSISNAPILTRIVPNSVTAGSSGLVMSVSGSGFTSATTVYWNGAALPTRYILPTLLNADVLTAQVALPGINQVTVSVDGVSSNSLPFTVTPAAALTSLSPSTTTAGGAGFTLTVNGSGFGADAGVLWNSSLLPTTVISSSQITASVPADLIANLGTAQVSALSGGAPSVNSLPFNITAAATLTSLSPSTATAGGAAFTLTVNGTGFASDATVLFNGAAVTTSFVSATQLTAAVQASQITTTGTFPITVVSGGVATSNSLPFTVSAAPTLSSIAQNTATAGSVGFPITLTGTGFTASTTALWNGTSLTTTFVNATQLTAAIPASLVAFSGINQVTVAAGGVSSNSLPFTVTAAAALTSLSPNTTTAGGTAFTLTVNGSGFGTDATVLWNGTPLPTVFVNATRVTTNVPANLIANVSTPSVTVVSGGVTSVNSLPFTIVAAATLTSLAPNSATAGSAAFTLTVNGTGFSSDATVLWNGAALVTTVVNATQLTAAVPASQITTAGTFPITVVSGGVASASSLPFTVSAAPALTSISPNSTIAGSGNFTLTANGSGFNSAATVNWNGSPLTTTFVSATQLTAAVPAGLTVSAGTSVVTVSQGGVSSNSLNFTTAAAPVFASISPTSVTAGSTAFTLTVNGSGFAANASVLLNGAALATTLVNASQLQATVPASVITTPGSVAVTIVSGNATLGPLTLTVVSGPAISSLSPASTTAGGAAFTLTVAGTGFGSNAAVQWNGSALATAFVSATQLTAAVPASLTASAGTASVTVTSGGTTSNSLTFTIASTQTVIAPVSLTGLPSSAPAGSTQTVGVQLGNAAPVPLTGTLQLSFSPSVTGLPAGYIDPNVVFASGSTTSVNFTIPAGSTVANVPQGGAISLGTVAGTIAVTLTNLTANGVNVLPSATVTSTVVVQAVAPVINAGSVKITNVSTNGFTVQLTGYSTTREVSIADFVFTAANGSQLLGSTEFTVPVTTPFATWFSSTQGQSYGSQFSLQVPFTISGSTTSVVQGVSVTLRNSAGTSTAVSGTK